MFSIGQKVVCVHAHRTRLDGVEELIEGRIYTIRWCGQYTDIWQIDPIAAVQLVEVDRGQDTQQPSVYDRPFGAFRFRPVIERKTDISIFTAMLDKPPARELEFTSQNRQRTDEA